MLCTIVNIMPENIMLLLWIISAWARCTLWLKKNQYETWHNYIWHKSSKHIIPSEQYKLWKKWSEYSFRAAPLLIWGLWDLKKLQKSGKIPIKILLMKGYEIWSNTTNIITQIFGNIERIYKCRLDNFSIVFILLFIPKSQ